MRQKTSLLGLFLILLASTSIAQNGTSIRGQITDQLGGAIVGASVTVTAADGRTQTVQSDARGAYRVNSLSPGDYSVHVSMTKFSSFDISGLALNTGQPFILDIKMKLAAEQKIEVASEEDALNTDPSNNKSAKILKGRDLDALPDDPDDLQAALLP